MSLMEGVWEFGRGWGMDAIHVVFLINVFRGTHYTSGEFQSQSAGDSVLCRLGNFLE